MALNVLIVDDSATMRKIVIRTLGMSGLPLGALHEAGNGREGLDVLEREWIDVVFVDINMPVMTGMEMIDAIRAHPTNNKVPVVVVSTESSETRMEELKRRGVPFIHKPFTPEHVREVVQGLTGVSQDAPSRGNTGGDF